MTLCESQEALRIFSVQTTAPSASHPMGAVRFTQLRVSCPRRPARRERSAVPAASPAASTDAAPGQGGCPACFLTFRLLPLAKNKVLAAIILKI